MRINLRPNELIVDNFAGGGGASVGIEMGTGRSPDIAINHDREAIAMHKANHPTTRHLCEDVFDVDPRKVCGGRPVGLAWFSPDCTYHSKARGGKPHRDRERARRRRGLAGVVIRWANTVRPRVIFLENVEEWKDWGPLLDTGLPDPERRGLNFRRWCAQLRNAGYTLEMRELRACDFGAPTTRKRLFVIARCDGAPIVWPEPTHGPGRAHPYRVAAECIDWSLPCPSIFGRKKPLAEKTLKRIARGIMKFVVENAQPFIVPLTHARVNDSAPHSIEAPLRTVTGAHRGELALIAPSLIQTGYGERPGQAPRALDIEKPLGTIIAGGTGGNGKHALVSAYLAKYYGDPVRSDGGGGVVLGSKASAPVGTVTTRDHHALVTAHMLKLRGTCRDGQSVEAPAPTITASGTHLADVRAFLTKYYGSGTGQGVDAPLDTVTTRDRFGLVWVRGEPYQIADIGQRMLQPRELFNAQGFPPDYVIDALVPKVQRNGQVAWKPLTKTAAVRMCGNSVCPPIAAALISANLAAETAQVA
jgi:DNA (cytosine-5)-methyltransferase 1